jgi:hypothetical protein
LFCLAIWLALPELAENVTLRDLIHIERMIGVSEDEQSRVRNAVRHILMSQWDPIGVSDTPEAADEYDGYIGSICDLLARKASDKELAAYLREIEMNRMGLTDEQGAPLLPAKIRDATVSSLKLLTISSATKQDVAPRRSFHHWKLFTKNTSSAYAKTQQRREAGVCIGCGSNPCKCKNPKRIR